MALQVWLPLNGDSHNQGFNGVAPTTMGTGITYSTGKIGQAAVFPNNCNSCIHMAGLRLQTGSFVAWIKINGSGATSRQCIVSEGRDSYNDGVEFYASQAGTTLYFKAHEKIISTSIELNRWYHATGTFGDGMVSLYINGVLIGTQAYTTDMSYTYASDLTLGKMSYSYTNASNYFPFNGALNDVRIYDHCLSAKEVKEISQGLVLHYKLDRTEPIDSSGYGNKGTVVGVLTTNTDTPRYDASAVFASGANYINAGKSGMVTDSISVNLWCKYSTWGNPASCTEGGGWNFENNGGYVSFPLYVSGVGYKVAQSTKTPTNLQGDWHMLTGTFDKTNVKIYIDGVLEGTVATGSTNGVGYANNNIFIGAEAASGTSVASTAFIGSISDFRIYATALSEGDILDLYHTSASIDNLGKVHSFEFEEKGKNIFSKANIAITGALDKASNGVGTYQQTNCQVTYENDAVRIYRPPNIVHDSSSMHNMWGGFRLRNSSVNSCHEYNATTDNIFGLEKGHTYIIYFTAKGQSSKAATSIGWTNQMGWGGGGLQPSPTNVEYLYTPANFNGEMECFYKFTVSDDVVKTCTTSYSYATSGEQYLSYNDFMYGFGYENTETLGTNVFVNNFRLFDITSISSENISLTGVAHFLSLTEGEYDNASFNKFGEMWAINFIEK